MNDFYKRLIEKSEEQRAKDQEVEKRESKLSQKDEPLIPKLRVVFPVKAHKRRWKKRH